VPPSRDDRQVIVFAGSIVAIVGIVVAGLLFLATGGTEDTPTQRRPMFLGLEPELVDKIEEGGPLYFANPFGDDGFWLDLEDGDLVALDIVRPGSEHCIAKWRDPRKAYVDCDDQDLTSRDLDRFEVLVGKLDTTPESPKDAVYVDLRRREPAPVASGGAG
jgi:hypothetical protein